MFGGHDSTAAASCFRTFPIIAAGHPEVLEKIHEEQDEEMYEIDRDRPMSPDDLNRLMLLCIPVPVTPRSNQNELENLQPSPELFHSNSSQEISHAVSQPLEQIRLPRKVRFADLLENECSEQISSSEVTAHEKQKSPIAHKEELNNPLVIIGDSGIFVTPRNDDLNSERVESIPNLLVGHPSKAANIDPMVNSTTISDVQKRLGEFLTKLSQEVKLKKTSTKNDDYKLGKITAVTATCQSSQDRIEKVQAPTPSQALLPQPQDLERRKSKRLVTHPAKKNSSTTPFEYECKVCLNKFQNTRHLRQHEKTHTATSQSRRYEIDNFIDIDSSLLLQKTEQPKTKQTRDNTRPSESYQTRSNTRQSEYNYQTRGKTRQSESSYQTRSNKRQSEKSNSKSNALALRKVQKETARVEPYQPSTNNQELMISAFQEEVVSNLDEMTYTGLNNLRKDNFDGELAQEIEDEKWRSLNITKNLNSSGVTFFDGFCTICGLASNFESSSTHYLRKDQSQPYSCLTCEKKFSEADWSRHNLVCFEEEECVAGHRLLTDAEGVVINDEAILGLKKKRAFICCVCFIDMSGTLI